MINFIYGNPGTGKSTLIYSKILEDAQNGHEAILLVPEQFAVAAEREIIKIIPPAAQLTVEVLNFTRLANRLFRVYGGLSYNFVSKAHEKLIMWRAIKVALPFLREYQVFSHDDFSLADSMLATYKELIANGITSEQIDQVADICDNSILSSKLKDISTICSIYNSMLCEKYTDTNSELGRLVSLLKAENCLNNFNVYIDGFSSFTGLEHSIIYEIMRQANCVFITLGIPSATYNGIDTISIKDCSDRLRRDCASLGLKANTIILDHNYRSNTPELKIVSSDLWNMEKVDYSAILESSESIEFYKAADVYDECEFAAAKAKELIEHGYRYKDIAIIARNIDNYRGIIEPALDNMNLNYFISEKEDLSVSPIAKYILSAIKIITHGWRRQDVITHLKTGLCGVSAHDSDIFECYTAKWNISGKALLNEEPWSMNPDGYTTTHTDRGEFILSTANRVRYQIISKLKAYGSKLKASINCKEMCVATMQFLEESHIREIMLELATDYLSSDKVREASDCARMFEVALDAIDCVCDAFYDAESIDINTFFTALRIAFSESNLGSIPTSQDEILLGSANLLRTDNIKCAIILGAIDGEFPASTDDVGLFSYRDREALIMRGIPITGNQETSASDELYYFRRAVSAPSEKLIVFTRSDAEPSVAFTRLTSIIPNTIVQDTSTLLLERMRSLKAVSEYSPLLADTEEGMALKMILQDFGDPKSESEVISVSADNDRIERSVIEKITGKELVLTQTKTESFINCKFAYSCKYLLRLDEGRKAEFSFNNIGTFIHYILEKFLFKAFILNQGTIPDNSAIPKIVNEIIDSYINELIPSDHNKTARLMHLIDRLKSTSIIIIYDLLEELSDSNFKPEFFELKIGSNEIPSVKITLKDGTNVSINGIIDRVDVYRNNGKAYIRVIDYKTGNKTFSISDIEEGLNLQMLLYIFSLTKGNIPQMRKFFNGDPVAAGVTYLSFDSSKRKITKLLDNEDCTQSGKEIIRSGLILDDEEVINAISLKGNDKTLMRSSRKNSFISDSSLSLLYDKICNVLSDIGEEMLMGNINAKPKAENKPCNYCRFSSICRSSQKYNG